MKFKKLAALMAVMTMVASFSVVNVSAETESAENETAAEETTNGAVQKIVANCESDSYGKSNPFFYLLCRFRRKYSWVNSR